MCSALEAAHGAGIVHRDLKPQNVFLCKKLGRDDFVKIVDFGISKVKDSSSVVTRDHSLMGTPFYMSPEQADGLVQQIDSRTDIFALGAIMWEMLVGRMAFEAPTISGAMYKVVHVDPPEVHILRPDVPPAVSLVLRRAMAKQKDWRYASVTELAYDFANACRGLAPAVQPPPMQGVAATVAPVAVPVPMTPGGSGAVPRAGTPLPVPHTPPHVHSQEAYMATGYVTPTPGTPAPPQPFTPPPQQMMAQPPPTSVPPHLMPQTNVPPHLMGQAPAMGTPPPQQMLGSQPGVAGAVATPSTMQPVVVSQPPPPAKKGKGALIGAIVGVVALGAAAAVVVPRMGGDKPGPTTVAGQQGDGPATPDRPDTPPTGGPGAGQTPPQATPPQATPPQATPPEVATTTPSAAAPDAGAAVPAVAAPPAVEQVTLTVTVGYEKGAAPKAPAPVVYVDGKAVEGTTVKVNKGAGKVKIEVREKGFATARLEVVPDADKPLAATLKKPKAAEPEDKGFGWRPGQK
jgi:serine/threonine-protein kinase